jgi:cytochrome c oxidase subunit 4
MTEHTESQPARAGTGRPTDRGHGPAEAAAHSPVEKAGPELHDLTVEYIRVAVVLAIVTLIEVATYYVALARGLTISVLLVLSAIKFSLVVLYFMHLKFDRPLLRYAFSGPLLLAIAVVIALMALFGVLVT